jgi:hypothetical protein
MLAPAVQHGVAQAVGNSLHDVFLVAGPIALAGAIIVSQLKERPLRFGGAPSPTYTGEFVERAATGDPGVIQYVRAARAV